MKRRRILFYFIFFFFFICDRGGRMEGKRGVKHELLRHGRQRGKEETRIPGGTGPPVVKTVPLPPKNKFFI